MLFPAKRRICPSAHPDLCLATFPPGGRSGGWEDSAMKRLNPYSGLVGGLSAGEPRAPFHCRRGKEAQGGDRRRHARRGRRPLPPPPGVPRLRGGVAVEGRARAVRRPALALPELRGEVHLAHGNRPRELQEAAVDLGILHSARAVRRAARRLRRSLPHHPPDRLGVAPPPVRGRRRGAERPLRPLACRRTCGRDGETCSKIHTR